MTKAVTGFSKKTKEEKIKWLSDTYFSSNPKAVDTLKTYWNSDDKLQRLHDDFIENTVSNFYLPFGVAPNFLINENMYVIPMVIEESSVVAAAGNAAKFWMERGGFHARVMSTIKTGQIHINYDGDSCFLTHFFTEIKPLLIQSIASIQANMKKRGGGLIDVVLLDKTSRLENYFQLHCTFKTQDAMGANFINSCLEQMSKTFEAEAQKYEAFMVENTFPEVVMSILSNYTPECLVKAQVSCPVSQLSNNGIDGKTFAQKFVRAVNIAEVETRRAVTHNKGIMNGIDAVVLATGNDFRAVEAGVHAFASRNGNYTSLTHAKIENDIFTFWIEIPLALGTVGGLTNLHPLVRFAFDLLQRPSAKELMQVVAVAGLAQNFAALRSLVTTGIQKGHMKMHLMNILNSLDATETQKQQAVDFFADKTVSVRAVKEFLEQRKG